MRHRFHNRDYPSAHSRQCDSIYSIRAPPDLSVIAGPLVSTLSWRQGNCDASAFLYWIWPFSICQSLGIKLAWSMSLRKGQVILHTVYTSKVSGDPFQYKDCTSRCNQFHHKYNIISQRFYLHNGYFYTSNTKSLAWDAPLIRVQTRHATHTLSGFAAWPKQSRSLSWAYFILYDMSKMCGEYSTWIKESD